MNTKNNLLKKRTRTKTNNYPTHTKYRHISSVLRDSSGYMCFSEEENGVLYIRKTNIKDIALIKPNKKGQRGFQKVYIDKILKYNITDSDYKGNLFMYCIHEINQKLRPVSDFTTNKKYPHLRPTEKIYGLQPFCKESKRKYVNNGNAGNSSRTKDQHLEDVGSRFRQKLIVSALGYTPKISYKDVYKKFDGCCFKCKKQLQFDRTDLKGLDHTLPHSYWWPYTTENATLLCTNCNQAKKDKWPSEFYTIDELKELSKLTNIDLNILSSKTLIFNMNFIEKVDNRFDEIMNLCESRFRNRKSPLDFFKKLYKESKRLQKIKNKKVRLLGERIEKYTKERIKEYEL
jgi:5-methylcytosine-specific restriction endonuclease McrA